MLSSTAFLKYVMFYDPSSKSDWQADSDRDEVFFVDKEHIPKLTVWKHFLPTVFSKNLLQMRF